MTDAGRCSERLDVASRVPREKGLLLARAKPVVETPRNDSKLNERRPNAITINEIQARCLKGIENVPVRAADRRLSHKTERASPPRKLCFPLETGSRYSAVSSGCVAPRSSRYLAAHVSAVIPIQPVIETKPSLSLWGGRTRHPVTFASHPSSVSSSFSAGIAKQMGNAQRVNSQKHRRVCSH